MSLIVPLHFKGKLFEFWSWNFMLRISNDIFRE